MPAALRRRSRCSSRRLRAVGGRGGWPQLRKFPFEPIGWRDLPVRCSLKLKLRIVVGLFVPARPMPHTPRAHGVLSGELLGCDIQLGEILSKWGFHHGGTERTLTRYTLQPGLYPMQVLDSCLERGHGSRMANRLAYFRKRAGFSQEKLGKLLHSGRSTVTKLERGEIPMSDRWLEKLAAVLDCNPLDILGDEVPIVGKIGAGGSIVFEDIGPAEMIRRPPDTVGDLVGLEVCGESMLPKFDPGDIVYISRDRDGVDPADIGAICACRLIGGETFLKQLRKGSREGLFTLRSYNAEDMDDVELEWATPIRAITPRAARRFG